MKILAAEAVLRGHPDKLADQISDAILDAHLMQDPEARVALEALLKSDHILLAGEISSSASVDLDAIANQVMVDVGYQPRNVESFITKQSPEITESMNQASELAPGDQAIVIGYATSDTEEYLPLPYLIAQTLAIELSDHSPFEFLRPDGKVLCEVAYPEGEDPYLHSVLVSLQHDDSVSEQELQVLLKKYIRGSLAKWVNEETELLINPSGSFTLGGLDIKTGVTGRKLVVDSYGPDVAHGGGALSGKDPTKIDRSGAYAARFMAKNLVAQENLHCCTVKICYAKGVVDPLCIHIDGMVMDVKDRFPLRLGEIIEAFDLKRPIYQNLAFGGHFGRDTPWEKIQG
ncbi:MAG: S-adenosylmethionine synthase [Chlamydiia bacterium]|nr:S-adenosylmethionine synthase [Chlamydiia bacterium]MCH9615969.1 S-adenosylmethionine synthase [Chlamydiia bacterium]MCH9628628.1 S-adenosylmethionine synthase [Chlamydiia bacterium]